LGLSQIGLRILMGMLQLGPTIAFLINLIFTASFSFAYLNLIAFRRHAHLNDPEPVAREGQP